jgi:DNA (cytosine-5)-methyltransferase 1
LRSKHSVRSIRNKANSRREITAGALFSGIGGFCLAFEAAGFRTQWACDVDPYACAVYAANFPQNRLIQKDIRNLSVARDRLDPVDILHAGFPCQSFSQAGARMGFDDDRGKLFFEIIRLVKEFKQNKPAVLVFENAPYLKVGEGGVWFSEITRELQRAGYWFRESNACELDLYNLTPIPQKRSRLFMVAWDRDRFRSGKFAFPRVSKTPAKQISKFVDFDGSKDDDYYLSEENRYFKMIKREKSDRGNVRHLYQLRKYFVRLKEPNLCPTLTANMGLGGHNVPFVWDSKGLRKLTEKECLRLQGFPASFRFPREISSKQIYTQIGNAVAPPVAKLLARAIKQKYEGEIAK